MDLLLGIVCAVSIGVVVGAIAVDRFLARRRCSVLANQAHVLDCSFAPAAAPFEDTDVRGLTMLEHGASTLAANVVRGTMWGRPMAIFDLILFGPSELATTATTFAAFRSPAGRLPVFQFGPHHIVDKVYEALAHKSVHLDTDPEFCRDFYLRSPERRALEDFLTSSRLAHLRQEAAHFQVETSPDWVVVFRRGMQVQPQDLAGFVRASAAVAYGLFAREPAMPQASRAS